jgi:nitrite reductase (NADH) large subunit
VLVAHFEREGIDVRCGVTVEALVGRAAVEGVHIGARGHVPAEVVVVCAGITPNVELARASGLAVGRGVLVDASMRTSAAGIYAAGDVAELDGTVVGLWSPAAEQAEIAAQNALGAELTYDPRPPVAVLKGAGVELTSVGRIDPEPDDSVLRSGSPGSGTYAMVIVDRAGDLAGAVVIGRSGPARLAVTAIHGDRDPSALLAALGSEAVDPGAWSWPPPWPPPASRPDPRPSARSAHVTRRRAAG